MKPVKDLTAEDWVILRLLFFRLRPNDYEIRRLELHRSLEFLLKRHNPRTIVEAMEMISKEGRNK